MSTAAAPQETSIQRKGSTLADLLTSRQSAIQAVLPKHLKADRLIKIALVAVSRTPKLKECTGESILQSVMLAAQLGLDCGGALGSAYLVPFKRGKKRPDGSWDNWVECQLIPGYRGLIDLARRSGQIVSIEARIVWQNDKFEIKYEIDGAKITHIPALDMEPGGFRLVYAVAQLKDGGTQFELMTKAQVDAIRSRSKSKDDGPWVTDYPEMARKTVVKRLCKYLPISVELADTIDHENELEFDGNLGLIEQASQVAKPLPDGKSGFGFKANQLPDQQRQQQDVASEAIGASESVDTVTGEVIDAPQQQRQTKPVQSKSQAAPKSDTKPADPAPAKQQEQNPAQDHEPEHDDATHSVVEDEHHRVDGSGQDGPAGGLGADAIVEGNEQQTEETSGEQHEQQQQQQASPTPKAPDLNAIAAGEFDAFVAFCEDKAPDDMTTDAIRGKVNLSLPKRWGRMKEDERLKFVKSVADGSFKWK